MQEKKDPCSKGEGGADGWCYWCFSGALHEKYEKKGDTKEEKWGWGRGREEGRLTHCPKEVTNEIWPFILDFSSLVEVKQVMGRKTITVRKKFKTEAEKALPYWNQTPQTKSQYNKIGLTEATLTAKSQEAARNNWVWVRKHILLCDHQWLNPMPTVKTTWQMTPRIQYLIWAKKIHLKDAQTSKWQWRLNKKQKIRKLIKALTRGKGKKKGADWRGKSA